MGYVYGQRVYPVDVICMFDEKGYIFPLRVRVDLGKSMPIIKVNKILSYRINEVPTKKFVEFKCLGEGKEFTLTLDVLECRWYLGI